jgi:hypothetical protein
MSTIKVHCIGQERWFIRRQHCKCGSRFEEELQQALMSGPSGPVDEITMRCRNCGASVAFQFDISSCAAHLQPGWMKRVEAYSKVMPEEEATQLVVVPMMERVLGFIQELQRAGDTTALEFIGEAVARAQQDQPTGGSS